MNRGATWSSSRPNGGALRRAGECWRRRGPGQRRSRPRRLRRALEGGQGTAEYVGVLAVVALVVALVLAAVPMDLVRGETTASVDEVLAGEGGSGAVADSGAPAERGSDGAGDPAGTGTADGVVLASTQGQGGGAGRFLRDLCLVLPIVCGNVTDANPLNDANVPKPPSVEQRETQREREEQTQPRQPQPVPSGDSAGFPEEAPQAPPIGDEDEDEPGTGPSAIEVIEAVGDGAVWLLGGAVTVLSWLLPNPAHSH